MKKHFNQVTNSCYAVKTLFLISAFLFNAAIATAQSYDPLTLSKKIFAKDSVPDLSKYSTGEYQGHPNGSDLAAGLTTAFTLLQQTETTAVVNVTVSNAMGRTIDAYMYFKKDSIWKATAFRALASTGVIENVNQELKTLSPQQVNRIIALAHQPGNNDKIFSSWEEYQYLLGNSSLTLASDQELIAHFNKNKATFIRLKNELLQKNILATTHGIDELPGSSALAAQAKALWLTDVLPDMETGKSNLNFLIGGVTDNTVGYLYVKDEKNVPEMSPGTFIMVRNLGEGWYLYKTT
jgi:hypothetical protein